MSQLGANIEATVSRFPRFHRPIANGIDFLRGYPPVTWSEITQQQILNLVGKSNPTILEIGCNDGSHTLRFIDPFEKPMIYCFEPDPRAQAGFRKSVGCRPNVYLFEGAVSDSVGSATFWQSDFSRTAIGSEDMPEGWDRSGSIRRPKEHINVDPWVKFERTITVPTVTLDAWCDENGIDLIDFIWMDVQGAELDVIRGGGKALKKTRFIYTEYSNKELYEGQANLKQILRHLPSFKLVTRYPVDIGKGGLPGVALSGAPRSRRETKWVPRALPGGAHSRVPPSENGFYVDLSACAAHVSAANPAHD